MVTIVLIGLNVVVSLLAFPALRSGDRPGRFLFEPARVAAGENVRGMLLSHFAHADLAHLFFNMLALFFFAPVVEHFLGPGGVLSVYVVSGVAATALTFIAHRRDRGYRALGASGSVSGIIFASIVLYPGMSLYLFLLPIPIPGPVFAVGYIAYSVIMARRQFGNIGHEAHIGGALAGLLIAGIVSPEGFAPLLHAFRDLLP